MTTEVTALPGITGRATLTVPPALIQQLVQHWVDKEFKHRMIVENVAVSMNNSTYIITLKPDEEDR